MISSSQICFRYFPVSPDRAFPPMVKDWPTKASPDPDHLKQFPNCNYGIVTGEGFIVIDVDSSDGHKSQHDGRKTYAALISNFPETLTVSTPSGGLHLYYLADDTLIERLDIRTRTGWLPGIDIRAKGGYVVGPGSVRGGIEYKVVTDAPMAALPAAFFERVKHKREAAKSKTSGVPLGATGSLITTAETSQYSEFPKVIPIGERDDVLFRYACSFRERNIPRDIAVSAMKELHSRCEQHSDKPYTIDEALAKISRAWKEYRPGDMAKQELAGNAAVVTTVETPEGPEYALGHFHMAMPVETPENALTRFVAIQEKDRVADLFEPSSKHRIMSRSEFESHYQDVMFTPRAGGRPVPMVKLWLGHAKRKKAKGTIYYPSEHLIVRRHGNDFVNIYSGPDIETPDEVDHKKIEVFDDHMNYLFPDEVDRSVFIDWFYFTVKCPHVKIRWAPVIITTKQQIGKGLTFEVLRKLLGEHNCRQVGSEVLRRDFNSFIYASTLVLFNELDLSGNKRWDSIVKTLVTDTVQEINQKQVGERQEEVFCNLLFFTNKTTNPLNIDPWDCRFWVYRSDVDRQSQEYYQRFVRWLHSDGPNHLLLHILNSDVESRFDPTQPPPMTEAKSEVIEASRSEIDRCLEDAIEDRIGPFQFDVIPFEIVKTFLEAQLGPYAGESEARSSFMSHSKAITRRPCVASKQFRVRSIRDHAKWEAAPLKFIADETEKAIKAVMGGK